jgi:hypothetical protein
VPWIETDVEAAATTGGMGNHMKEDARKNNQKRKKQKRRLAMRKYVSENKSGSSPSKPQA